MKDKLKKYFTLFYSCLYISAFTFGGGYVIISLMKKKFCDELHWISDEEMLDITAIAQSSPGAVAVNGAIIVGLKIGGGIGAALAIIATIIPPLVIITIVSYCYQAVRDNEIVAAALKGMQAGVAAFIADVTLSLSGKLVKAKNYISIIVMIICFTLTYFFKVNLAYIILSCAIIGIIQSIIKTIKLKKEKI